MNAATNKPSSFRAGLIQMRSGRAPAANLDAAVALVKEAKNAGAQYVLTPEMTGRANGRTTVPQIFIGTAHVGGCDDLYALEDAGKLDPLLKQHA